VSGRLAGRVAPRWPAAHDVPARDRPALHAARVGLDELLARRGEDFARPLQRALRDLMTECCGVVRTRDGLQAGLAGLAELARRAGAMEVRPDLAGYADLAHALDLHGSLLAARATLECALERRETRGAHNRSDFPEQDPALRANLVWSTDGSIERSPVGQPSPEVLALADDRELVVAGRLLE
jgi:succinate dehydrogenase / fumarate reductase flavoprotein subunit